MIRNSIKSLFLFLVVSVSNFSISMNVEQLLQQRRMLHNPVVRCALAGFVIGGVGVYGVVKILPKINRVLQKSAIQKIIYHKGFCDITSGLGEEENFFTDEEANKKVKIVKEGGVFSNLIINYQYASAYANYLSAVERGFADLYYSTEKQCDQCNDEQALISSYCENKHDHQLGLRCLISNSLLFKEGVLLRVMCPICLKPMSLETVVRNLRRRAIPAT